MSWAVKNSGLWRFPFARILREFKSRELNRGQESFRKREIAAPPPSYEEKSPDPFLTGWALGMHVYSHRVKKGSGLFLATLSQVPTVHVSKKDSRPRFYSTRANRARMLLRVAEVQHHPKSD